MLSASERFKALQAAALARRPYVRRVKWPVFPYHVTVRVSLWLSVATVALLFGWGAWQRRWIADDGLIVLRTVRNLLAGNGPMFNAGVEARRMMDPAMGTEPDKRKRRGSFAAEHRQAAMPSGRRNGSGHGLVPSRKGRLDQAMPPKPGGARFDDAWRQRGAPTGHHR